MELLDRSMQKELLTRLSQIYPEIAERNVFADLDASAVTRNLFYLHEHDLVETKFAEIAGGAPKHSFVRINAKGMDFLADDGGLGAILGVHTIRIHEDSIRGLLIAKVQDSDADDSVKKQLVDQLKSLPAHAVSELAERALDSGIQALPNVVRWLQTLFPG